MKVLILAMSCRADYFREEIDIINDTWAKDLPDNVDFAWYDGDWQKNEIVKNNERHFHIHTAAPDGLDYTFMKTLYAIHQVANDYDYILRTNTSTWINTKLLSMLAEDFLQEDRVYGTDLYSLTEAAAPEPLDIYARGNAILMSSKLWKTICNYSLPLLYMKVVDDVAIGNVVNSYFLMHGSDYLSNYIGLPHGWYKAVKHQGQNNHALCKYGEAGDANFYKDFLTVQTKMYRDRENEHDNAREFSEMMKDIVPSEEFCRTYSKDPSIFIGSVIGYIPLSVWKRIDKKALYKYEMQNKAIDDKQSKYFSQEAYNELHRVPGMK